MISHALILSSLLLLGGGTKGDVLFEDNFNGELNSAWQWIRPDVDEWRILDDELQVRSQFGRIWGGNDAKNVLVIRPSQTDNVEAHVNVGHTPTEKWEQAGLLWYVDDDNFVKLISEHIDGKMYAVICREQGGQGQVFGKVEAPAANMQLRLIVQGNHVTGQWRMKETDPWSESGSCQFDVPGDRYFGLFTQNGPKDQVRWVRFDSFAITKLANYKKLHLTSKFYCEGAYYADFNRDGKMDVISGPYWYAGPDFQQRYEVREPKEFDPNGYSDNFLTYTGDFNNDGWADILYLPWPGKDASWYENPAGKDGHWTAHFALKNVGNESPVWGDVNGDGLPDLAYNIDGFLGYGTWDPAKPDEPWTFHPISTKGDYQRYTHGVGIGDINGDGRVDILESVCWWEQPAEPQPDQVWVRHDYRFATDAAQMLVYDVDGDGLNDVVTSWHCHLYGLVWHRQVRGDDGQIKFQQHVILPSEPDLNANDLRISQLHALDLVDMNGDGLLDVLTGKRFWAHGPNGDKEPGAPAVLYWFQLQRNGDGSASFIPHQIDDDSGVGTQVSAADLNNDKVPDVVVGNKKGTFVFLSQSVDSE